MLNGASAGVKIAVSYGYWFLCAASLGSFLLFPFVVNPYFRQYVFSIGIGWVITQITLVLFFMVDDLRRGTFWTMGQVASTAGAKFMNTEQGIPRSAFLNRLGVGVSSTLFFSLLYGFGNKYKYQLVHKKVTIKNLPESFKGFKIIHISDIHSGSLKEIDAVQQGIDLIQKQKPDLILFTGDLVNDRATEMNELSSVFGQLTAPKGVYSILGNHDYGDYVQWPSKQAKEENLTALKEVHAAMGWRLLMNEHVTIQHNGEQIKLVGIENWGAKARFPKYGQMDKAMDGVDPNEVIILMSHDPSHWEAQVISAYPQVDLMLSGHTHGMQFGLENPYFKWSPVQYMYNEWAGIYTENNQSLYVNRGFGFLGYPGRLGVLPEITVLDFV
jgi:predicted MPP superfamily phosphohydrolase